MKNEITQLKSELKEQNDFLKSMVKSFNNIKKGKVRDFKFSHVKSD